MSPSLALQAAMRMRFVTDPAMIALVPADDIADQRGRPERFPSITLGEDQELRIGEVSRRAFRVVSTLHVWAKGDDTSEAKRIADAMRRALRDGPWPATDHVVMDLRVEGARYLRDPDGDVTHGVVTVEAFMLERS